LKKLLLFFFLLIAFFISSTRKAHAQFPNWLWARYGISDTTGWAEGWSVATDLSGNVYLTGAYEYGITFGSYSFITPVYTVFLVKYDSSGNVLWAKSAGGSWGAWPMQIITDINGGIYVTGKYHVYPIIFGNDTLSNSGTDDIFVVKYDSSGNELWARGIGGLNQETGISIAADNFGNCFATGYYESSQLVFGNDTITNLGNANIFLVKYDSNGNVVWVKNAGGNIFDIGYGVATDGNGNIYLNGALESPISYFESDTIICSYPENFFLAKYDSAGNIKWVRTAAGNGEALSIAADKNGNTYSVGVFGSTMTFGGITINNVTGNDFFIVKYNAEGEAIWAKRDSSNGNLKPYNISLDHCNNSYITGSFLGTNQVIYFDTVMVQQPSNSNDALVIVKYDSTGQAQFALALPTGGDDNCGIALDQSGNIYIGGDFAINPFILGNDTMPLIAHGEAAFIAKLENHTICEPEIINELINDYGASISPNPFHSLTTLHLTNNFIHATLKIYNTLGSLVKEQTTSGQSTVINREGLENGIYFIRVSGDGGEWVGKVIIE
jgi:hypothetical protein